MEAIFLKLRQLESGAMPKEMRELGELLHAIRENNVDDVKYLISGRLNRKREKQTLLCGSGGGSQQDIRMTADVNMAVIAATKLRDNTILTYIIKQGVNVNFLCDVTSKEKTSQLSPLHVAVSQGITDNVVLLLDNNADVNKTDSQGRAPLHIAVKKSDVQITRLMLYRGAKVNALDRNGQTPLQIASKYGHVELVRTLLEHDAKIFLEGQQGPNSALVASIEGHIPLLDMFLRYVDVNAKMPCGEKDNQQTTLLHSAAERGLVETVRFLLERFHADVNILDSDDQTALHCVLARPHDYRRMRRKEDFDRTVEVLIARSVKIGQRNDSGNTALHLAAMHQYHRAAEHLLMARADPNIINHDGLTASDVIPQFDAQMKQLFIKYSPFSSPYLSCKIDSLKLCETIANHNFQPTYYGSPGSPLVVQKGLQLTPGPIIKHSTIPCKEPSAPKL